MATDRTIPEALVYRVAKALILYWNNPAFEGQTAMEDAKMALSAIPNLTGPGPNGEWGRWEQLPDRNQFGNLQHHYLCPVYRFVPGEQPDEEYHAWQRRNEAPTVYSENAEEAAP